ncbi:site-specific integrase [Thermus scotoductus]|uniref:Site-specific integrase n=1 Tax=Thermus scotoductus TaxID=37636 RepID=A0A430S6G8_THESC|nr:tyrosine-type recombinase/integrase [Thermus scotoductus]RTG94004.1 site-specific integrase [Thermus scotoductus]RTH06753.1 site-specific integrase [Thermus scotoductus]RTH10024.1 site-specific integrase [Thermus scotoductus]RTH11072.1 site-specific integrase [Thermus scotoductus]RTH15746.1 site-specific integrase [Thermus scotoductus]
MKRKRGRGEGSIFRRKDGRWAGFVTVGYTPDGRQVKRWVYGRTRQEVAEKLARLLPKAWTGTVPDPTGLKLGDWLLHWVEERALRKGLRPTTIRNYRVYMGHLEPILRIPLTRLTSLQLRAFFADLAHFSPSHRRHIYQFLRAALRDALRTDLIPSNPMDAVDPPEGGAVRPARAWTPEEVARFLEASKDHRLHTLFRLMLATGLRIGEALALRWEDWQGDRLWVRHTLRRDGTLGPPKTPGSMGYLYLDPDTQVALATWQKRLDAEREQAEDWQEHGLIFPSRRGTPLEYRNVLRAFNELQAKAGVTPINLHGLRHTYTSLALRAGLPPKVVAARLRHKDVKLTLQVYQQLMDDDLKAGAVPLDTLLHLQGPQKGNKSSPQRSKKKALL